MSKQLRARYTGSAVDLAEAIKPHVTSKSWLRYDESTTVRRAKIAQKVILKHIDFIEACHRLQPNLAFTKRDFTAAYAEVFIDVGDALGLRGEDRDSWISVMQARSRNLLGGAKRACDAGASWTSVFSWNGGLTQDDEDASGEEFDEELDAHNEQEEEEEAEQEEEEEAEQAEEEEAEDTIAGDIHPNMLVEARSIELLDLENGEGDDEVDGAEEVEEVEVKATPKKVKPMLLITDYYVGFDDEMEAGYRILLSDAKRKKEFGNLECAPGAAKTDAPIVRFDDGLFAPVSSMTVEDLRGVWARRRTKAGKNSFYDGMRGGKRVRAAFRKAEPTDLYVIYLENKQVLQVQLSSCGDDRDEAMRVIRKCAEAFVGDESMTNVELKFFAKGLMSQGRKPDVSETLKRPSAALKKPSAAIAAPKAAPKAVPKAALKNTSTGASSSAADPLIFVPPPNAAAVTDSQPTTPPSRKRCREIVGAAYAAGAALVAVDHPKAPPPPGPSMGLYAEASAFMHYL
jgi:hypothetical protein